MRLGGRDQRGQNKRLQNVYGCPSRDTMKFRKCGYGKWNGTLNGGGSVAEEEEDKVVITLLCPV